MNRRIIAPAMGIALVLSTVAASGATIDEIVVTAQKREQNIQEVPIAITTLDGYEMRQLGYRTAADIQYQTPGLIVSYSSTNAIPNFVLRGVGLNDFTAIQSSPVAIHVDEVFHGNSTLLNFALFDLERVEVLKGPQGTLFGRNTTGGAVNFFSAAPTEEFEAGVDFGYGRYDALALEGYLSGALGEGLLGRLSVSAIQQDGGPFSHPAHGEIGAQERFAARGQLLWEASDRLSARLAVFGGQEDSEGNQYQGLPTFTTDGEYEICDAITQGDLGVSAGCAFNSGDSLIDDGDPFTLQSGIINRDDIAAAGAVLTINYELSDQWSLISVTGYNRADRESQEDADGAADRNIDVGYRTDFNQLSQELRLASSGTEWDWTLGVFYSTDKLDTPLTETDGFDLEYNQNHTYVLDTDALAAFAHGEYHLSDRLRLIAGLRYTTEDRHFTGGTFDVEPAGGPSAAGDFLPASGTGTVSAFLDREINFSALSWTFGASLDLSEQAMAYGKISNGFKSGGFIGDITVQSILEEPYDEETLTSYEIGIKSEWLDRSLRLNAALFYYDYNDVILALSVPGAALPDDPGFDPLINENGADAEVLGFESELWLVPADGWDLKLGLTWLDTETTRIDTSPYDVQERLDGNELIYAPQFSGNGLARYEAAVAGNWLAYGQIDFTIRADHWAEATNTPISKIEGYALLNARVGLGDADGKWSASIWMKNIADEEYSQYLNDLQTLGSILITPGYPRSYGIDVSLSF